MKISQKCFHDIKPHFFMSGSNSEIGFFFYYYFLKRHSYRGIPWSFLGQSYSSYWPLNEFVSVAILVWGGPLYLDGGHFSLGQFPRLLPKYFGAILSPGVTSSRRTAAVAAQICLGSGGRSIWHRGRGKLGRGEMNQTPEFLKSLKVGLLVQLSLYSFEFLLPPITPPWPVWKVTQTNKNPSPNYREHR